MDLKEIIAVSGHSGLFKLVARGKNNIIVESLVDGKRMPVFANDKANSLADIAVFTNADEIPLKDVLQRIYKFLEQKEITIDYKNKPKEMMQLFEQIMPEYDKERVYPSDVKKIFTWYNILLKNNLIVIEEPKESIEQEPIEEKNLSEQKTQDEVEKKPKNTKSKKQIKEGNDEEKTEEPKATKSSRKKKSN